MSLVFDSIADPYDRWYDTPEGDAIFRATNNQRNPSGRRISHHAISPRSKTGSVLIYHFHHLL